jgi:hypothetical protein
MLRVLAILYGIVFIAMGILGFLPDFTSQGLLFGYFLVNPMHNAIHLVTGLIAFFCGLSNNLACKIFFIVFGFVYLAAGGYGFYTGSGMLFDLIAINQADNIFHLIVGLVSLYFGFALKSKDGR